MCGRFTFASPPETVADHFRLMDTPAFTPRYNIAPSEDVPVVALKSDGERFGLAMRRWGLVTPGASHKPINARADFLHKPTFAFAFTHQRRLLPATGFYEWRAVGKRKKPVHGAAG